MVWYSNAIWIPDSPTIWIPKKWAASCFLLYGSNIQTVGLAHKSTIWIPNVQYSNVSGIQMVSIQILTIHHLTKRCRMWFFRGVLMVPDPPEHWLGTNVTWQDPTPLTSRPAQRVVKVKSLGRKAWRLLRYCAPNLMWVSLQNLRGKTWKRYSGDPKTDHSKTGIICKPDILEVSFQMVGFQMVGTIAIS